MSSYLSAQSELPKSPRRLAMPAKRAWLAALAVLGGGLVAMPSWAHHTYAMFDFSTVYTVKGTVQSFHFTNPHSFIELQVPNGKGGWDPWRIQWDGPAALIKQGVTPESLKPGQQVTLVMHPLKDGSHGGYAWEITMPDGRKLEDNGTHFGEAKEQRDYEAAHGKQPTPAQPIPPAD